MEIFLKQAPHSFTGICSFLMSTKYIYTLKILNLPEKFYDLNYSINYI